MLEEINIGFTKSEKNKIEQFLKENNMKELCKYVKNILQISSETDQQNIQNWLITVSANC